MLQSDVLLALGVVAILVVLILPLPALLLDVLLALSITLAVLVLLTALLIEKPLDFNVFPTVLLITTMLRLALNIASTRLILSEGHVGPAAAGDCEARQHDGVPPHQSLYFVPSSAVPSAFE